MKQGIVRIVESKERELREKEKRDKKTSEMDRFGYNL